MDEDLKFLTNRLSGQFGLASAWLSECIKSEARSEDFFPPSDWFNHDTWTVEQALLLLAGIDPNGAEISWNFFETTEQLKIENADILICAPEAKWGDYYGSDLSEAEAKAERCLEKFSEDEQQQLAQLLENQSENTAFNGKFDSCLQYYDMRSWYYHAELRLDRLCNLWMSRKNSHENPGIELDAKYEPHYYLSWIKSKEITKLVPWWDKAVKDGFIPNQMKSSPPPTGQNYTQRSCLNVIGALLEIIVGDFKGNSFSTDTELRSFISEKFGGAYGIGERTTAGIFSQAKKSINSELQP
ncbi:hypothetical protein [Desulfosediminicola ganghwensis]|uniref:hypothetical protein n=1 Tax=Desulfosediminicola ganghwensis TaxID=2569540 RepID=UPI0010ABB97E|nr:hypothetical protein [Desulfosediminicola ganghwensis]